jgi:hypothetical protein
MDAFPLPDPAGASSQPTRSVEADVLAQERGNENSSVGRFSFPPSDGGAGGVGTHALEVVNGFHRGRTRIRMGCDAGSETSLYD